MKRRTGIARQRHHETLADPPGFPPWALPGRAVAVRRRYASWSSRAALLEVRRGVLTPITSFLTRGGRSGLGTRRARGRWVIGRRYRCAGNSCHSPLACSQGLPRAVRQVHSFVPEMRMVDYCRTAPTWVRTTGVLRRSPTGFSRRRVLPLAPKNWRTCSALTEAAETRYAAEPSIEHRLYERCRADPNPFGG
jgi:hypothetical protein